MKLTIISLLALATEATLFQAENCSGSKDLTVQTSTGAFTGLIDPEFPNTRQFLSIPFAEPPVGSRRWLPPQKLSSGPNTHRYATKLPPLCPQFNGAQNDTSGLVGEATSEDCLHLAVWTRYIGGVNLPWQIPTSWVDRTQSHIVVSINYRLNIFGFPNARGLADGEQNLGILDQRAALEWVRDSIAAFGGNPSRITQWGRSSGSISTDVHAFAYREDPIAQAYYMESSTIFSLPLPYDATHSNFSFVARHVGCDAPCGSDCVDEDDAAELDYDRIVFNDYNARAEAGKIARLPTMISMTANEWSSLVPWPTSNLTEGPYQLIVDAGNLGFGVCPALNSTVYQNRLEPEVPVFRFQYAATFPNLNVYDWLGAYHNSETPLVFGTYGLLNHIADTTEFQVEVSRSMQDHILAFAKDPYHGPQTLSWEPMVASDPNGGHLLRFGGSSGKVSQIIDGIDVDGVCLGLREYNPFP